MFSIFRVLEALYDRFRADVVRLDRACESHPAFPVG